ncbi:MAG: YicC family protein, partial [Betaproteobacteria bacterium]|nr:YicC family protein [Betaproteobacteria bacterium]
MIYSMTGFAMLSRELDGISIHIELRSVNSRYLDLSFRISDDLRAAEPSLRELISARLTRGKVECRLNLQMPVGIPRAFTPNTALLARLAATEATVLEQFPNACPLSVSELLHWPGALADDSPEFEQLQPVINELTAAALGELLAARRREGEKLVTMIRERIAKMRELTAAAAPRIPAIVEEYRARLTRRLQEVLTTADEERIIQETVLYASRIDVAEELTRLSAHLDELERILATGGASGKRLDFLMQELNREANTLASKSQAPDITGIAMEMKVQIEQIREQVQ